MHRGCLLALESKRPPSLIVNCLHFSNTEKWRQFVVERGGVVRCMRILILALGHRVLLDALRPS